MRRGQCVVLLTVGLALLAIVRSWPRVHAPRRVHVYAPFRADEDDLSDPPPLPPPPPSPPPLPPPTFHLPAAPASLTLTFGTAAVWPYVYNWLRSARALESALTPYAAVALDEEIGRLCHLHGEPTLSARSLLLHPGRRALAPTCV